uniref:Cytochrome C-III n=1 Tax=Methylovorus sp. (strain SS1 / DSM 11726) TaxID=81683 RepID=Q9L933_METSS|nr:cytochrome C-III [Methylovorus sp. SS1]
MRNRSQTDSGLRPSGATVSVFADDLIFRGSISGEMLDFKGLNETETDAVKKFKQTGVNPYNGNAEVIKKGESLFATACSGCHGHLAERKLGPALSDDYWTYPKNSTDKGLFETIFGWCRRMMGPQRAVLTQDEMLQIMSWVRSIYNGDPDKAKWLNN